MAALALAALAVPLAACGSGGGDSGTTPAPTPAASADLSALAREAAQEGKVTFYSSQTTTFLDALKANFTRDFPGIEFTYLRGSDSELQPRLTVESSGGGIADVADIADKGFLDRFASNGLLVPPTGPVLDANRAAFPGTPNYFKVYGTVFSWAWNTDLVPNGIHSWADLTQPDLKGMIAVTNISGSPILTACIKSAAAAAGPDVFQKIADSDPQVQANTTATEAAITSGEAAATFMSTGQILLAKKNGAPVDRAIADAGSCPVAVYATVPKSAPHPKAAQLLANYLLTPKIQELAVEYGRSPAIDAGGVSGIAGVAPTVPSTPDEFKAIQDQYPSFAGRG